MVDGLKNGQAQKFEYCTELCWKLIKIFLFQKDGIDSRSPKQTIKEFYLSGYIDNKNYMIFLDIIDDRNKLSHIYKEEEFNIIINKFKEYIYSLKDVYNIISSKIK